MVVLANPPKMVYDEAGRLIEVILPAEDYLVYLQSLAAEADWETLPPHLQDAIDRMLIAEVRTIEEPLFDRLNGV